MTLGRDTRRSETSQIHSRISRSLVLELKLQARRRKTSVSDIVEAAVMTFLNQTEHEAVIDHRMDKHQKQLEKVSREQQILLETMATFVKVYLAHTPEFPEAQKALLEEKGLKRYEKFIGLVAHAFENEILFRETIEERIMTKKDFVK